MLAEEEAEGDGMMIAREKANKITATLKLVVTEEFYDDDASEETLRSYVEQCLEEAGFNVEVGLVKAQEPRVLTLDEVTTGDECWLEHKSGVCGYVDCYISTGNQSVEVWRTSKQGPDYLSWESYLKDWRCWSARPTDEQREVVKWDD